MQVHLNAAQVGQAQEGELSLNFIKKYIGYCRKYVLINKMHYLMKYLERVFFYNSRVHVSTVIVIASSSCMSCYNFISCSKCGPRLSEEAAQMLKNRYVLMRSGAHDYEKDAEKKINIPITVR